MYKVLIVVIALSIISCETSQNESNQPQTQLAFKGVNTSILKVNQPGFLKHVESLNPSENNQFLLGDQKITHLKVSLPVPMNLIIAQEDSLVIDLSSNNPTFTGIGAKRNELLFKYQQQKNEILKPYGDVIEWVQSMDENSFLSHINSIESELIELAVKINETQNIEYPWLNHWITFDRGLLISKYIWTYFMNAMGDEFPKLKAKINSYLPLDPSIEYFPALANQWSFQTSYLYLIHPLYVAGIYEIKDDLIMDRLSLFGKDTILKQVMLGTILEQDLTSFDTALYVRYQSMISQTLVLPSLKSEIESLYQDAIVHLTSSKGYTTDAFVGDYNVNNVLDQIIADHKGKVIYLDIWATWCKPCLEEFKISKRFKANFDPKEIAYVYVGAQSQESAWRAMINKFELEGTHLLISEDQYDTFTERFPIGYFPSYYILDQNGDWVTKDANLSPSHPKTIEVIKNLLD